MIDLKALIGEPTEEFQREVEREIEGEALNDALQHLDMIVIELEMLEKVIKIGELLGLFEQPEERSLYMINPGQDEDKPEVQEPVPDLPDLDLDLSDAGDPETPDPEPAEEPEEDPGDLAEEPEVESEEDDDAVA